MSYSSKIVALLFILHSPSLALVGQTAKHGTQRAVVEQAAAEFRAGRVAEAEELLRSSLRQTPRNPAALGLLGIILDAQKRYPEAESAYRQALALAPGAPGLLNNLGNHYLALGKPEQARAAFLKVVSAEPHHLNADVQLAQLNVDGKQGAAALKFLDQLLPRDQSAPSVAILRAQALKLSGQDKAAENLLAQVESNAGNDPGAAFSVGMTFAGWKRYGDAENAFARALNADPTNFDILYNLGLAAQHAGHLQRAAEVYRIALRQRPEDADCLFNLGSIAMQTGHADEAIVPLMEARKAAPDRPAIILALAEASKEIGFYEDAALALDDYLKLKPQDDIARRDRGLCRVFAKRPDQGLEDLRWYTQRHPQDSRGLYELAIAETMREPDEALGHLDQALAIDPKFDPALYARAVLFYQGDKSNESIADLKLVLAAEPNDFRSLDVLGQNYTRLKRLPEATDVLERAYRLAPKDAKILSHYSQALARSGRQKEAEKVMAEFQSLSPQERGMRRSGGLFEYLNLPREQQHAEYMENLRRNITAQPDAASLQVQLGKALLQEGNFDQAIVAFRAARKVSSDPELLAACGRLLLGYNQFTVSREFLESALAANPSAADLRLDLAIAVINSAGAEEALKILNETPSQQRRGDYYLLRAQILDAMNRNEEAAEALNRGFAAAPTRADLYFQGAIFLIKHGQYKQAISFLDQANQAASGAPELQLLQAMTYELAGDHGDTLRLLAQIELRWPEWALPYMVHGITLAIRSRWVEAKPLLENAIALGADNGITNFYLALVNVNENPARIEEAYNAISKALQMNPEDVYAQSMAGKIDYLRRDYPSALGHLNAALRMWPDMLEAHETLAGVYKAVGEKEKSIAELKKVLNIKQENPSADQAPPFPTEKLLFSVKTPRP